MLQELDKESSCTNSPLPLEDLAHEKNEPQSPSSVVEAQHTEIERVKMIKKSTGPHKGRPRTASPICRSD